MDTKSICHGCRLGRRCECETERERCVSACGLGSGRLLHSLPKSGRVQPAVGQCDVIPEIKAEDGQLPSVPNEK